YNLARCAPFRLCRYFSHNDARLVASRILESDVKVAVCFDFHQNDATSENERVVSNRIRPAPTKNVQWSDRLNCARTSRQKWRISFWEPATGAVIVATFAGQERDHSNDGVLAR